MSMTDLLSSPLYNKTTFTENRSLINWNSLDLPLSDRRFDFTTAEKGYSFAGMSFLCALFLLLRTFKIQPTLSFFGFLMIPSNLFSWFLWRYVRRTGVEYCTLQARNPQNDVLYRNSGHDWSGRPPDRRLKLFCRFHHCSIFGGKLKFS